MRNYIYILTCFFALLFLSCGGFKLDSEKNCLNQESPCFKWDKTDPLYVSATPAPGTLVTTLPSVTMIFSEALKNGEDVNSYKLTPGLENGLTIQTVQKIADYTYRLTFKGSILTSTLIELDFSALKDYSDRPISGQKKIQFTGNVSISLVATFNHNGVSNTGGYGSLNISFSHNYVTDPTNNNSWEIRRTHGLGGNCNTGGVVASGTFLAPGTTVNFNMTAGGTAADTLANFNSGNNVITICLQNQNNANANAQAFATIIRDDVPPATTYSPLPYPAFSYRDPQSIPISCSDNMDKIAYAQESQTGSAPANPFPPAFTSGVITSGQLYTGPLLADNSAATNPTFWKFSWQCIDIAGNVSSPSSNVQYYIDLNIPAVNVTLAAGYHDYVSPTGYTSTQLDFTTDQAAGEPYKIIRGGTTGCTPGGGETVIIGVPTTAAVFTPATGVTMSHTIPSTSFAANQTNDVAICVFRTANSTWGAKTFQIVHDSVLPTVTPTVASGNYGYVQYPIFSCSNNADKVAYTIASQLGATAPANPPDPTFDAAGNITNGFLQTGPITTPDYSTTKIRWRCLDKAGNLESAVGQVQYTIDSKIPTVNLVSVDRTAVTNNAGGYADATVIWNTDRAGLTYNIKTGSANCVGGTSIATGTTVTGSDITNVLNFAGFPTNGVGYDVKICVTNFIGQVGYPSTPITITRDNTVPTMALGVTTLTNPGDGTITLGWTSATDTFTLIEGYDICQSTFASPGAGSCAAAFTPTYQAGAGATSFQVTGLNTSTTYYFMVRARDSAGNRDANVVEKKSKLTLSVAVTGYASAVPDFRIDQGGNLLSFTSNVTQSFPIVFSPGDAYAIQIVNQPGGQNCAFTQNQFGTIFADTTLNVTCVNGYMVGGAYRISSAAALNYMLYRGNTSTVASSVTTGLATFVPSGIAFNGAGTMFLGEAATHRIYRLNLPVGSVTVVAGSGVAGTADGLGAAAQFYNPSFMTSDGTNLYVSQVGAAITTTNDGDAIRKIDATGNVTTLVSGAQATDPEGLALSGNILYWANRSSHQIKAFNLATGVISVIAGSGTASSVDGTGTSATFNQPMSLVAISGRLYVTEFGSHRIRSINIATQAVTTLAGSSAGYLDGAASIAQFNGPAGLTTDGYDLYIPEYYSRRIRRVRLDRTGGTNHQVTTISGSGASANTNGVGAAASFIAPVLIATDGRSLYVSDEGGAVVRKITDYGQVGLWPVSPGVNPNDYNSDGSSVNNGTGNGGSLGTTVDRFGGANLASTFNGSTQYVTANAPITVGGACNVTMAVWYKPNAIAVSQGIAYNGNSGSSGFGIMYNPVNGFQILFGGVGSIPVSGGYKATVGQWTHVTARCVSGRWALFVNGHKTTEATATGPGAAGPVGFQIGRDSSSAYTDGSIADVRVYNRALSEGEINELAQDAAGTGQVGSGYNTGGTGLLSHFEFNGGSFVDAGALNLTVASGTGAAVQGKDSDPSGAYRFNGTQFFTTTTGTGLPIGSHPRTMCAWTKTETKNFGWYTGSVAYGTSAGGAPPYSVYSLAYSPGSPGVHMIWGDFGDIGTSRVPNINTWTHICATFDGSTNRIYENGTEIVNNNAVLPNTQAGALRIGCWVNGANCIIGSVDDVRIYNNALSSFQIRQLAVQIPDGLVARYDFTGDKSDVSGYGQDLSNNGVTFGDDRFSLNSSAAKMTGGEHFDGTMAGFPLGTSARTVCAWTNPATLFNGTFSEVVMYGTGTSGWGFGMDASGGLPNGRIFILDTSGDLVYNQPHGLDIWRHICSTYDGSIEQLYVDGNSVAGAARVLTTAPGALYIGRGTFGPGDYFNGYIDDVRIYNRALSTTEIQMLVQQPNKRMVFSATANAGMHDGGGGISGADAICVSAGSGYKALIIDGSARRACTTSNCATGGITENIDWVLRPNATYLRSDNVTPIQTANFNSVFPFPLLNSVGPGTTAYWTGFNTDWTGAANCLNGSSWNTTSALTNGIYGLSNQTGTGMIFNFAPPTNACSNSYNLVCVQQ